LLHYQARRFAFFVMLMLMALGLPAGVMAQGVDVTGRPIASVIVEGVKQTDEQLVRNQISTQAGDPYDTGIVARDIQNITRLGRFSAVRVRVDQNDDGTVNVAFVVNEDPLLSDVQVVGNKNFSDQELLEPVLLRAGDPRDPFLIDRAKESIRRQYQDAGYFLADVAVDEQTLSDTGILILRVREGPRVKIRGINFVGNETYTDSQLKSKIKSNSYVFIFAKGILSREQLDQDVGRVREFYQQGGYLDARVGRRINLSDDQNDATVDFVIDEGRQYTVSDIVMTGNELFSDAQIREAMTLKVGDVFSQDRLKGTDQAVRDLYGRLGYVETRVNLQRVFHPTEPTVSLRLSVKESIRSYVGSVIVRGNELTQDKVVRRQLRGLEPGRPIDGVGIRKSKQNLEETSIIRESKITLLGDPEDEVRDVLVEVKEANTGSLSFGAAISSDSGLFGAIDLTQRNFDIADYPDSWGEFLTGRAFRGAGQYFSITLQPGNEFQRYQVTFREPYMFDSDYFLDTNLYFFQREREDWEEKRLGGTLGVGRRFGDVWSASVRTRLEQVEIYDLDPDAPVDAFEVEGTNAVDTVGFFINRSTVDSRLFPTRGTKLEAGIEQAGIFGSDFEFTRLTAQWNAFLTLDEDFFGRKTVLSFRVEAGYLLEEAPLYERFYAGGHRSFRGFDYRGVGPRGIRQDTLTLGDDPVGGDFLFLFGTEYNFPIWEEILRGVLFVDTGTVQKDFGFDEYRVAIGTGIRIKLPFLGQAPFAFDVAYPIIKEEGDEERVFSFDIALPF
jgi:outer membrane protein insertion porin family